MSANQRLAELEALLPTCPPEVLLARRFELRDLLAALTGPHAREPGDREFSSWQDHLARARALDELTSLRLRSPACAAYVLARLARAESLRILAPGGELDEAPSLLAAPCAAHELESLLPELGVLPDLLAVTSLREDPLVCLLPRYGADLLLRLGGGVCRGMQSSSLPDPSLAHLAASLWDPGARGPLASLHACVQVASELGCDSSPH